MCMDENILHSQTYQSSSATIIICSHSLTITLPSNPSFIIIIQINLVMIITTLHIEISISLIIIHFTHASLINCYVHRFGARHIIYHMYHSHCHQWISSHWKKMNESSTHQNKSPSLRRSTSLLQSLIFIITISHHYSSFIDDYVVLYISNHLVCMVFVDVEQQSAINHTYVPITRRYITIIIIIIYICVSRLIRLIMQNNG
jgi:hypothetical protein